jgi:UDP-GlcNAc:undecaprenyl-phosphate GlcNAc-1-phosphate transferase
LNELQWIFLLTFGISFFLCFFLVPPCVWISRLSNMMDRPGGHKSHEEATPLLGGVAIFMTTWITMVSIWSMGWIQWSAPVQGIFLGSTIVFLMGLVDDAQGLPASTKFIVQVGAALVVILHGGVVSLFMGTNILTVTITLLWIVGITNSFNLLDNMDGLTAGVAAICSGVFALIAFRQSDVQTLLLATVMMGTLLGFLRFNFDPAEVFMGDAGSGFIGFFLGCMAVYAEYLTQTRLRHLPIITPILIFSVPLFDTFSVMAIRVMEGRSIWDADNKHFSHRLVSLGLTRRAAVLLIYLVTFTVAILATFLTRVTRLDAVLLLIHAVAIFAVIILLEYAGAASDGGQEV